MRHLHLMLLCAASAAMVLPACGGTEPATGSETEATSSDVGLALSASGVGVGAVEVLVTSDASMDRILDQTFAIHGGETSYANIQLVAGAYDFEINAYGGAGADIFLGTTTAHLDLAATGSQQLVVSTDLGADEDNDGQGDAGAGAGVKVDLNEAPEIDDVDVALSLDVLAASTKLHVSASDDAEGLQYFWSGVGLEGGVHGTVDLEILSTAAAALPGDGNVHVFVQDDLGALASATVHFTPDATCALCGGSSVTIDDDGELDVSAKACLSLHADCVAQCNATGEGADVHAMCMASCGVAVASCFAP